MDIVEPTFWGKDTERFLSEWFTQANDARGFTIEKANDSPSLTAEWLCSKHQFAWRASLDERISNPNQCRECKIDVMEN